MLFRSGSSVAVTISSSGAGSVPLNRTLTGSGGAQAIVLSNTDVANLKDGTVTVTARATDAAGNQGDPSTLSFGFVAQPVIGALSIVKGQDGSETGPAPMTFLISRTGSTAQALTVYYRLTNLVGNLSAGSDYLNADSNYATNGFGAITLAAGNA